MATSGTGSQKKLAAKRSAASRPKPAAPQPRPVMPRWLKYTLAGLILFTVTLPFRPDLVQLLVCAFALGLGVWQLWMRRASLWRTGALFLAVGLYVLGVVLAGRYEPFWVFYFAAWIFLIVAVVAEAGRSMEQRKAARSG